MARIPTRIAQRGLETGGAVQYPNSTPVADAVEGLGTTALRAGVRGLARQEDEQEKLDKQNQLIDNAKADAFLAEQSRALVREFEQDQDYSTFGERFEERAQKIVGETTKLIRDPFQRQMAEQGARELLSGTRDRVLGIAETKRVVDATVTLDESLETFGRIYADPTATPAERASAREAIDAGIQQGAEAGLYGPDGVQARRDRNVRDNDYVYGQRLIEVTPDALPPRLPATVGERSNRSLSFFQERGWTKEQAAGIVGTLLHESGGKLDTGARNPGDGRDGSDSIGIGQWNADRAKRLKSFASKRGRDWQDFDTQLDFVDYELRTTEGAAARALRSATTVEEATAAMNAYERPQGWSEGGSPTAVHGWDSRVRYAKQVAGESGTPDWFKDLAPQQQLALERQADSRRRELSAERDRMEREYLGGFEDYTSFLREGNLPPDGGQYSPEALALNLGPERAGEAIRQVDSAMAYGADVTAVKLASPDELAALVTERQAEMQNPEFFREKRQDLNGLVSVIEDRNKKLVDDPAAYTLQAQGVRDSYDQLGQVFSTAAPPDQRRSASQAFAQETLAEQARLGLPSHARRILPKDFAGDMVRLFEDQSQGGQNAAQLMNTMADQWGKYWPQVFGEMAEDLPGTALVVGAMNRPEQARAAERLAEASKIGTPALEKALPSGIPKDVRDSLDTTIEDFAGTLVANPGGTQTLLTFQEGIYQLALTYAGQGDAPQRAAQRAYDDVIGKKYTIRDTYRVPVELDADAIESGAAVRLSSLGDLAIDVPASLFGLDQEQAKEAYLSVLEAEPLWVTSTDETGLTLYDQTQAAVTVNGLPLTFTWAELAALGADAPTSGRTVNQRRRETIRRGYEAPLQ